MMKKDLNSAWRIKSFYIFTYIIMSVATIFSVLNFFKGHLFVALVEVTAVIVAFVLLQHLKRGGSFYLGVNAILTISMFFVLFLFYSGGYSGNGIFWLYPFILLTFFIGGRQFGLLYSLLTSFFIIMITVLAFFGYLHIPNTIADVRTTLISYYLVLAMAYIYERRIITTQNALEKNNEKLHEAKVKAEFANEQKSRFLATMSHEIRTPLNAILGFVDVLKKSETVVEKQNHLETIKRSGNMLLAIINDILDFSKIESGKIELTSEPFSPKQDFDNIIRLFYLEAVQKEIRFVTFIDPKIPDTLYGDALRIKQVLSNLLSNAFKFTPNHGRIAIDIKWVEEEKQLYFIIEDNGIGIEAQKLEQIFKAFEQEDSSTTRKYGGTGLGLAISEKIVNMMHSHIYVSSEKGVGSRFSFRLQFESAQASVETFDRYQSIGICTQEKNAWMGNLLMRYFNAVGVHEVILCDESSACESPEFMSKDVYILGEGVKETPFLDKEVWHISNDASNFGEKHIALPITSQTIVSINEASQPSDSNEAATLEGHLLVAEDNQSNRMLIGIFLDEMGLSFEFAVNGVEAVEKFVSDREGPKRFDAILMDENMPEMTGSNATKAIRAYENEHHSHHIPIIAISANVYEADKKQFLEAGMDSCLEKPLDQHLLFLALEQILHKR